MSARLPAKAILTLLNTHSPTETFWKRQDMRFRAKFKEFWKNHGRNCVEIILACACYANSILPLREPLVLAHQPQYSHLLC